jgi:hypothetical protein
MKTSKLAAIAAVFALAIAQSPADQTNLVQNLRIQLFGLSQGATSTNGNIVVTAANSVAIDTRRVIAALAASTGNSFSITSRLVVVTPLGGGPAAVQVRDGSNVVDVSSFLIDQSLSGSVESSFLNKRTGRSFGFSYSVLRFALQDSQGLPPLSLHFDVSGVAVDSSFGQGGNTSVNVSGAGDRNGALVIFQGSIELRGQTLEVVPGDSGGGSTT